MGQSLFRQRLDKLNARHKSPWGRQFVFVPYDQLHHELGPQRDVDPKELTLVMIESGDKPKRRDYHKQKLALVLTNLRHFALERAAAGAYVLYLYGEGSYGQILAEMHGRGGKYKEHLDKMLCCEPAEYELREDLRAHAPFVRWVPHNGWLSTPKDFAHLGRPPWRMDRFYRHMRKTRDVLMDAHGPIGGRMSHDTDNRRPYHGSPPAPELPTFKVDDITQEVGALVEKVFGDHMGKLDLGALPATATDAQQLWRWAKEECLVYFGPFEDAMSREHRVLFHTTLSMALNLQRLSAHQVLDEALALPGVPLSSREGFVRQLLGWREFVRHVHRETDGLRKLPTQNALNAQEPLPDAYWGKPSGLACLDIVVREVMDTGYSHHITRLMILSNLATLLDFSPRELTDWFWCAYVDAYDWVVEPNVLGMGTFALGETMITKPYVSGAAYIDRMSDYCKSCKFSPKKNCPITPLYWQFLTRNQKRLAGNPRLALPLKAAARRPAPMQAFDHQVLTWAQKTLRAGEALTPEGLPKRPT